jgi:class 3 adenylate cyclase
MYLITVNEQNGTPHSYLLEEGCCVVGRAVDRAEREGRNEKRPDLILGDKMVSRHHLRICSERGQLSVEDLKSTNGTLIERNGVKEKLEPGRTYPLVVGQPIYFGVDSSSILEVAYAPSLDATRVAAPTYRPRFVGVLYSDIVSSTQMTARLGPERATELLEWHNQMFRERFRRFGGRETKFTGDGFEAIFPSVTDALGCAAACQRALARRNHQDKTKTSLQVRMGVNGGEAPTSANGRKVYGMPLILAARVMAKATAAQVLVPAHVAGIVAGSLLPFAPYGRHELKGIEEPVELLEFLWQLDPSVQNPTAPREKPAATPGEAAPRPRGSRTG